ncbi:polysaccharide deacetylase family protein [Paenibacillaceae bacterium]|nr:polysaccharide deacetylase family protein [Paenibacillaceae bacterium]
MIAKIVEMKKTWMPGPAGWLLWLIAAAFACMLAVMLLMPNKVVETVSTAAADSAPDSKTVLQTNLSGSTGESGGVTTGKESLSGGQDSGAPGSGTDVVETPPADTTGTGESPDPQTPGSAVDGIVPEQPTDGQEQPGNSVPGTETPNPQENTEPGAGIGVQPPVTGREDIETDENGFVKQVALTFDDGPDAKYTQQVLEILKEEEIKATFFLVGKQVKRYPEIVQQIVDEGHAVGNHSFDHANFSKLTRKDVETNIEETDQLIEEAIGQIPLLFRAPYGASSDILKQYLKENNRHLAGWNVDTRDWAGSKPEEIMEIVKTQAHQGPAKSGVIVLMHTFGGKGGKLDNTVEVLPDVIAYFKAAGYTFVTMEEMEDYK